METTEAIFVFFCIAVIVAIYYSLPYNKYDKGGEVIIPESNANLVRYDCDELEIIKKYWQFRANQLLDISREFCLRQVAKVEKVQEKKKIKKCA